jgi:hypothetical protein
MQNCANFVNGMVLAVFIEGQLNILLLSAIEKYVNIFILLLYVAIL